MCIVHNMCEIHGETFVDEWMNELESSTTQMDSYVNTPSQNKPDAEMT